MKKKTKFLYSSSIKLGLALGDWTTLRYEHDDPSIEVSNVDVVNFDSLSKQHLKKLHHMHYQLASFISHQLSKDMDIKVELHTVMVTQIPYDDFVNSISSNVYQIDINIPKFGQSHMILSSDLAFTMVDRLLGGDGTDFERESFTQIENDVLKTQISELISGFTTMWEDSFDYSSITLESYSGPYHADNRISSREAFVVFTVYLYFGGDQLLRFMVAYPNDVLRSLITAYNAQTKVISPSLHLDNDTLDTIQYDVVAKLGRSQLTMGDFQSLSEGDIIPLDTTLGSLISLQVGGKVGLEAQPCVINNKIGCQLVVSSDTELLRVKLSPFSVKSGEENKPKDKDIYSDKLTISERSVPASSILRKNESAMATQSNDISDEHQENDSDLAGFIPDELNEDNLSKEQGELSESEDNLVEEEVDLSGVDQEVPQDMSFDGSDEPGDSDVDTSESATSLDEPVSENSEKLDSVNEESVAENDVGVQDQEAEELVNETDLDVEDNSESMNNEISESDEETVDSEISDDTFNQDDELTADTQSDAIDLDSENMIQEEGVGPEEEQEPEVSLDENEPIADEPVVEEASLDSGDILPEDVTIDTQESAEPATSAEPSDSEISESGESDFDDDFSWDELDD